jgi:hypothetical protein
MSSSVLPTLPFIIYPPTLIKFEKEETIYGRRKEQFTDQCTRWDMMTIRWVKESERGPTRKGRRG